MTGPRGLTGRLQALPAAMQVTAVALAGAVSALGFAPYNLLPVIVLAFCLFALVVCSSATVLRAALLGWAFGAAQFACGLFWISESFQYQIAMPAWLGLPAVLLLAAFLALFPALSAAVARGLAGAPAGDSATQWRGLLLLAVCWTASEMLRGWVLTGFPWNLLGSAVLAVPQWAQLAALSGVYGLTLASFLLVAVGVAFLLGLPRAGVASLFALALLAGGWLWGEARLDRIDALAQDATAGTATRLHIVQANVGQDEKWVDGLGSVHLSRHLDMTRDVLAGQPAGIVIWPETAVAHFLEEDRLARLDIAQVLGPGSLLLTGSVRIQRDMLGRATGARNSVLAIDDAGDVVATYDKAHLVPFGEFLPLRPVLEKFGLARLAPGGLDFIPGPGPGTLALPGQPPVGVLICYEAIFPGRVVDRADPPDWLLNVSNDGWFGRSAGPHQHLAQARLRAIEEGRFLVRSTSTGISAIIDPAGRILRQLPIGYAGYISFEGILFKDETIFGCFHHLITLFCSIGLALACLVQRLLLGKSPTR